MKLRSAIERQLLVISEAAIRLDRIDPSVARALAPEIDWAGVRGMGNYIRHRYDDIDASILERVIGERLSQLREGCERALRELSGST